MYKLVTTSLTIVITAVVTTAGLSSLVDSRVDQERQLRDQLTAHLIDLNNELESVRERLDRLDRANLADNASNSSIVPTTNNLTERPYENKESLRALVSKLMEEERTARRLANRDSQWKRLREWQEYREGPYGKHNVRVNRMNNTLELDYSQTSYYHTLIADYEQRANALYEDIGGQLTGDGSDLSKLQDVLQEIEAEKRKLDEALDQAFIQTLSSEQASRYMQLPREERGVGPNAGLSRMNLNFSNLRAFAIN